VSVILEVRVEPSRNIDAGEQELTFALPFAAPETFEFFQACGIRRPPRSAAWLRELFTRTSRRPVIVLRTGDSDISGSSVEIVLFMWCPELKFRRW
jgi:hypothetical protein